MCGIIGTLSRDHKNPKIDQWNLDQIAHRGPDGRGVYSDEYLSFGHTRLSIIDLSETGHQPMEYADSRYVITYNGEIYNYLELRKDLEEIGEHFISNSDTEVILGAYHIWGKKCVNKFRGMFAFAIWDKKKKTLFLARDRCGEKPLLYWQNKDVFLFSSEYKGLIPLLPEKPVLNPSVVDMYLHYQYVPEPFTLLEGIKKLPAGHCLTIELDQNKWIFNPECYWSVSNISPLCPIPNNEEIITSLIREKFTESIALTLRSDVPVGVSLSGGIDSSAIAVLAQKQYPRPMHAFSVGYPGRPSYDEREEARNLANTFGMVFHEVEIPVDHFVDFFPEMVRILDEPIADIAAFGHFAVPKAAAKMGVKVLLTGIGGDEVFWGYTWTIDAVYRNMTNKSGIPQNLNRKQLFNVLKKKLFYDFFNREKLKENYPTPEELLEFFPPDADFWSTFRIKEKVFGPTMSTIPIQNPYYPLIRRKLDNPDLPLAIQQLLFDTWLVSNCLTLGDRVSMSVGVETRLPFLDYEFIELVFGIRQLSPDHSFGHKARLRNALTDILPSDVLNRPKKGFQPPVYEWINGVVEKYFPLLLTGHLVRVGILNDEKLRKFFNEDIKHDYSAQFMAYKLLLLEFWCREFIC